MGVEKVVERDNSMVQAIITKFDLNSKSPDEIRNLLREHQNSEYALQCRQCQIPRTQEHCVTESVFRAYIDDYETGRRIYLGKN